MKGGSAPYILDYMVLSDRTMDKQSDEMSAIFDYMELLEEAKDRIEEKLYLKGNLFL